MSFETVLNIRIACEYQLRKLLNPEERFAIFTRIHMNLCEVIELETLGRDLFTNMRGMKLKLYISHLSFLLFH